MSQLPASQAEPLSEGDLRLLSECARDAGAYGRLLEWVREREKRHASFEMVLQNLGEGVVVCDQNGKFLVQNRAAERLIGPPVDDIGPEEWSQAYGLFELDGESHVPAEELPLARALAGEVTSGALLILRNPHLPSEVILEVYASPVLDEEGNGIGGLALFRDVTERSLAQRERDRLIALAQHTSDMVITIGADERVRFMNEAGLNLLGIDDYETQEVHLKDIRTPTEYERFQQEVRPALMRDGRWRGETAMRNLRTGEEFPVSTVAVLFREEGSARPLGIGAIVRDLRREKEAEAELSRRAKQLAQAHAELRQFTQAITHDLREPARTVRSFADLLVERHGAALCADGREFLDFVQEGALRMQAMLDALQEFAREDIRERGSSECDLEEVLERVLTDHGAALEDSCAEILREPLPVVAADPVLIERVLHNLIGNSIKFRGSESPRVEVGAARQGDAWRITVRDGGIGIEPRHAEDAFKLFRRLDPRSSQPGTGVGLALCRRIVERQGGRIWIDEAVTEGCAIHFTLPAQDGARSSGAPGDA
jgi:PAS domain S-box-containing protein